MPEKDVVFRMSADYRDFNSGMMQMGKEVGTALSGFRALRMALMEVASAATMVVGPIVGLGYAVLKLAQQQQEVVNSATRMNLAMSAVSGGFQSASKEAEKMFDALYRVTDYSKMEQRNVFTQLVWQTNDVEGATKNWNLVADLAAGLNIDLGAAAKIVGEVMKGNTKILHENNLAMFNGVDAWETLANLQKHFGGTAEKAAGGWTILGNSLKEWSNEVFVANDAMQSLTKLMAEGIYADMEARRTQENIFKWEKTLGYWQELRLEITGMTEADYAALDAFIALRDGIAITDEAMEKANETAKDLKTTFSELEAYYNQRQKMAKYGGLPSGESLLPMPSYEYGGVVPGAIGSPQLAIVHGGEQWLGAGNRVAGEVININVHGSVVTERDLVESIRRGIIDLGISNVESGIK